MDINTLSPDGDSAQFLIPLLQTLPGFGPASYWKLRQEVSDLESLLSLPLSYLEQLIPARSKPEFRDLYRYRQQSKVWQKHVLQQQSLMEQGISVLCHDDLRYPQSLSEIHTPPPVLYVKGSIECLNMPQLALVGSRHASPGGSENAFAFAKYLASVGFGITSGLALGIDTAAHRGALAGKGATIAVLGTGIDVIYPRRNLELAEEICCQGGAIISEFPLGTKPHGQHFPRRNRIISGLSLGVLVVEAALPSGSLITARYALEQNREVFAIPGSIHNPLSRGCHSLIRDGATLVETAADIAAPFNRNTFVEASSETVSNKPNLDAQEQELWAHLGFDASNVGQLVARSGLQTHEVIGTLTSLEIKGLVVRLDNHSYQRA